MTEQDTYDHLRYKIEHRSDNMKVFIDAITGETVRVIWPHGHSTHYRNGKPYSIEEDGIITVLDKNHRLETNLDNWC